MPRILCSFGCDEPGVRQLKNGKWLCSAAVSQCPAMRLKNGAPKCGKNPFADRPHPRGMAGKVPWNRGLTWDDMYSPELAQRQKDAALARMRVAQEALAQSSELEAVRRAKLAQVALQRGLGGYQRGSGRGRKGWYRGFWCDSTYELAFVVWAVDHEIPFERNLEFFPYQYEGRVLHWTPDFLLGDGTYIEIKGYLPDQAQAKFEYFLRPLTIFTRIELRRMSE